MLLYGPRRPSRVALCDGAGLDEGPSGSARVELLGALGMGIGRCGRVCRPAGVGVMKFMVGCGCEVAFPDIPQLDDGHWPYDPDWFGFACVPVMFPL